MTTRRSKQIGPHLLAWTLLALTTGVLFWSSYKAWGHPIIDLGRDLYLPAQILEGRILYREVLYNYGPIVPYLLAGLIALLGDNLWVFESFGIFIGLATMTALYAVGSRLEGVWLGFSAAFSFIVLSFFANSTWGANFVLPYSFAATLATALAVWSFYFLYRYLFSQGSSALLVCSVAFLFAAAFTKIEVGIGIAAAHMLAWWAHRFRWRTILLTVGAGVVLGLLFIGIFAGRGDAEHALFADNLAKFSGTSASSSAGRPFFGVVAGLDRPVANFWQSVGAVAKTLLILVAAGLGGLAPRWLKQRRYVPAILGVLCLAACGWLIWSWAEIRLFQATPLLALGVVCFFVFRDRTDPLLLLAVFVLFAGLRIALQFHPMWYGFYLAVPAYLFLVYLLGVRAPDWLPDHLFDRRAITVAIAVLGLLVLWRFEATMWQSYEDKSTVITTAKGALRVRPTGRGEAIQEFLEYARERLAPGTRMVVLPEGVSLNYFTGLQNPTAYYLFTPPEIGSPAVEQQMIKELETAKPEILVLTSRDLTEFGHHGIGLDYALELGNWIRSSYDLERVFEIDGGSTWRLVLLRRS